jgi:predicted dehydrogenase
VRVGVIGTGFGARVVAPAFAAVEGCDVVEVVSPRDARAVETMCRRADLDLVSVHSPPYVHASDVRLALANDHSVLCDKPFSMEVREAEALLAEAERANVIHLLNFEFRFHPVRARIKELVDDGAIGRPSHVHWTHLSAGSRLPLRPHGWLFDRQLGGGWIGAFGSHAVDFVRWVFGEVVEAEGFLRTEIDERPDEADMPQPVDVEDGFTAFLATDRDVTVTIDSSFACASTFAPRMLINGTEGVLECVADARLTLRRDDGSRTDVEVNGGVKEGGADPHAGPMHVWAELVCDAVRDHRQIEPSFADGVACDRVLERLRSGWRAAR